MATFGQMIGGASLAFAMTAIHLLNNRVSKFEWESAMHHGPKAGVFGTNTTKLYLIAFSLYGLVLSGSGVSAHRTLGYVVINAFTLTWALAILMLSLLKGNLYTKLTLSFSYCAITIILRQSVTTSRLVSSLFEIAFPIIIAAIIALQRVSIQQRKKK